MEKGKKNLEGKVCLITGAGRGIGAAIARCAAYQGAQVVVNYNSSQEEARILTAELRKNGNKALAIQGDVGSERDVAQLFSEVRNTLGGVDLLVNNAGVTLRSLLQDTSTAEWDRVMNVNLKGAFLCCREALPHMIRKKYGRIVNIASVQGIHGASFEAAYAASKGGLIALTRSLGTEVAPSGITVNAIAPGPVATDMIYSSLDKEDIKILLDEIPAGRLARPEEIASACTFLLSDDASYINAQVLCINGGWGA